MVDLIVPKELLKQNSVELNVPVELGGNAPLKNSTLLGDKTNIDPVIDPQKQASLTQMGTALAAEIGISETGRIAGATVAGPIGYIIGGLASGAAGSYIAQKMINPDNISAGRMLADAMINLIPGAKGKRGMDAIKDATIRQGAIGAGIGAGGVTVEKGFDEQRMPTIDELTSAGFTGAALGAGLGLSGAAFSKAYSKIEGLESRDVLRLINTDKDVGTLSERLNILRKKQQENFLKENEERYLSARENWDDENIRQRMIQDEVAGGLYKDSEGMFSQNKVFLKTLGKDDADYYLQKRLSEQKIKDQTDAIIDTNKAINDGLIKKGTMIHGNERTADELSKTLDSILYAKHAINVNKRLGDNAAGINTKSAQLILDKAKKNGTMDLLNAEIKELQFLSRKILDTAEAGGLVSKKQADIWRKERPDYVPLNRINDETDIPSYFNPRNTVGEVTSTGIKTQKGSDLEVASIRQNINENLAQTIRRAETNKANIAFKKLLDQNKDIADVFVKTRKDATPYFKQTDKTTFQDNVKPSDNTLSIFENGERTLISFKDPKLAAAFKGRRKDINNEFVKGIFNAATWINRRLGSLYTRYSPEFMIPNLSRDRTESFVNSITKMGIKGDVTKDSLQLLNPKNIGADMKTVYKMEKGAKPTNANEEKLFKQYKEFKESGGAVGGYGLSTVQQVEDKVASLANMTKDGSFFTAGMKQKAEKIDDAINDFNKMFEDGTRFGVFRMMRNKGYSADKAALAARNSSFDPTLGGKNVGIIRAGYLFANPAIQANKILYGNVTKSKKNLFATLAGLTAITSGLDFYNSQVDPEWREKIKSTNGSNWITNRNLVFMMPPSMQTEGEELKYFSLPIGYALVPLKVSMDKMQQYFSGGLKEDGGTVANEIREEFLDTLNPFGGSLVPTPVRPYFELMANEDGLGRAIRPEWLENENMHSSEKIYPWTARTYGGEMAMALADTAKNLGYEVSPESLKYLAGTYFGGPGQFLQRILNVTSKLYNGETPSPRDIPVLRRFFGESYEDIFEKRAGKFSEISEIAKEDNTEKSRNTRIAYDIFNRMEEAKPEERRQILADEILKNPQNINEKVLNNIAKRIKNAELGLTSTDARVKSLTIDKRAQYLVKQMENMTIPEIQKFIKDQQSKGILTANVEEQLVKLKEFRDIKLRKVE